MKCRKMHVCLHRSAWSALEHPSTWAGLAGVLTTLGAELDKPYSYACFAVSAFCSVVAVFIRTPPEHVTEEKPK